MPKQEIEGAIRSWGGRDHRIPIRGQGWKTKNGEPMYAILLYDLPFSLFWSSVFLHNSVFGHLVSLHS